MKKMAIIHTSAVSLQDLTALCQEIMPEVEIINIIDDSLLAEVKRNTGDHPGCDQPDVPLCSVGGIIRC